MKMMNQNKDTSVIPSGHRCIGNDGRLCPYYQQNGTMHLNRNNCEFANVCKKDCEKERCEVKFCYCSFKEKMENTSNGDFLLANKCKICGKNTKER